jgi:hypothetical protein
MQLTSREASQTAGAETARLSQPFAPDRIQVKGEVAQSNLIRKVQPIYPAAAKLAHVQGAPLYSKWSF